MKNRLIFAAFCLLLTFFVNSNKLIAQSPGLIIRPAGGAGVTLLNPDGNGWSSKTTSGFVNNDLTESEIEYKVVPPPYTEPTGDLKTGPNGGFTDIVRYVDGSGFYMYSDNINLYFRFRISDVINGSKAYSAMIDTDLKFGNKGAQADSNYIAPGGGGKGNPGFEFEVTLETNFRVAVYSINGSITPTFITSFPINTHSQISVAKSTDSNTPDYFYDFVVPLSSIGNPANFRVIAGTKTAPNSLFQGQISDLYGFDDATLTSYDEAWTSMVNAQCGFSVSTLAQVAGTLCPVCTAPPVVTGPVSIGNNVIVSGTWTRQDAAKPISAAISLFKNDVFVDSIRINSTSTWSITVASVASGDVFYAKAQAIDESQCLQSNILKAGCASLPNAPVVSCGSTKGLSGTLPAGSTIRIYELTAGTANPLATPISSGLLVAGTTWNLYGTNPQSGSACQGQQASINTGSYMVQTDNAGCLSEPVYYCVNGSAQNSGSAIGSNTLSFPALTANLTTLAGSGATNGDYIRLYINNVYTAATTATASNFNFKGLSLNAGDTVRLYKQVGAGCMSVSPKFPVTCYTYAPSITSAKNGKVQNNVTAISGLSMHVGAILTLYRGTAPGTTVGTVTVAANGTWSFTGLSLNVGEVYYTQQTINGCTSAASASVSVVGATTVCPAITGTYTETDGVINGTIPGPFTGLVTLYLDGDTIGSQLLSNAANWAITVNSTALNKLYPGAALMASATETDKAENIGCGTTTVTCTAISNPSVSPSSISITTGQTANFTISNTASGALYSLVDNTAKNYAVSKFGTGTSLQLNAAAFNTPGTYSLKMVGDAFKGSSCRGVTNITVTVNNATLPVNFLAISVVKTNNTQQLTFKVTNEQNVLHYEVERSSNCLAFEKAGIVAYNKSTAAVNNYSFADVNAGQACYRVRLVNRDGSIQYSKIVMANDATVGKAQLSPNPATSTVSINFFSSKDQTVKFFMVDMNGRILNEKTVIARQGSNNVSLQQLSQYASGQYLIKLVMGEEQQWLQLIKR